MIQTKVARIFSETQVVLAAGAAQGVCEGMEFIIYELGDPVFDPETNESLGQIEVVKGRVKVSHVQEKISVATVAGRSVTRTIPTSGFVSGLLSPKEITETVYDKLKVEGTVALERDLTVRVGDCARSVQ